MTDYFNTLDNNGIFGSRHATGEVTIPPGGLQEMTLAGALVTDPTMDDTANRLVIPEDGLYLVTANMYVAPGGWPPGQESKFTEVRVDAYTAGDAIRRVVAVQTQYWQPTGGSPPGDQFQDMAVCAVGMENLYKGETLRAYVINYDNLPDYENMTLGGNFIYTVFSIGMKCFRLRSIVS